MLAITLVMAVAFLALAKRERDSVNTVKDTTIARLASETVCVQCRHGANHRQHFERRTQRRQRQRL